MVHHLWYDSFDAEVDDARPRPWRNPLTRQPAPAPRRSTPRRRAGRSSTSESGSPPIAASGNKAAGNSRPTLPDFAALKSGIHDRFCHLPSSRLPR